MLLDLTRLFEISLPTLQDTVVDPNGYVSCRCLQKLNVLRVVSLPTLVAADAQETQQLTTKSRWNKQNAADPGVDAAIRCGPPALLEHFVHIAKVAGVDHVGIGSDFDGVGGQLPEGMEDISKLPEITYELLKRGYSDADVKKVLGENFLRTMAEVERVAKSLQASGAKPSTAKIGVIANN